MAASDFSEQFRIGSRNKFKLKNHDPRWSGPPEMKTLTKAEIKEQARTILEKSQAALGSVQELLFADDRHSALIIFQGMDASGKDGAIKHVMSGVNPRGCQVYSFKRPTPEEYDHTFLWRYARCLPERGRFGIFNRSYYEDVLIARVHPEVLGPLPDDKFNDKFWNRRYEDINAFEKHLVRNGTIVLKFFLNVSKSEQRRRLLERLNDPTKNWKFNPADVTERSRWNEYMACYQKALRETDTNWAPWHVIPADHKWVARVVIARIIAGSLSKLKLSFPKPTPEMAKKLREARLELSQK